MGGNIDIKLLRPYDARTVVYARLRDDPLILFQGIWIASDCLLSSHHWPLLSG